MACYWSLAPHNQPIPVSRLARNRKNNVRPGMALMEQTASHFSRKACMWQSKTLRKFSLMGLLCLTACVVLRDEPLLANPSQPVVFVAPIEGVIDLGLAPFVQRVLDEATAANANAVILEINTFGGRVDAAVLIRDALFEFKVLTVAFINKRAISAGALILIQNNV